MEAHNIRPAKDADIVVTPDLLEYLIGKGWPVCEYVTCIAQRPMRMLKGNEVDILSDYSWMSTLVSDTDTLIREADIVQGVPFAKLEVLLKWKEVYSEGLPPDNKGWQSRRNCLGLEHYEKHDPRQSACVV